MAGTFGSDGLDPFLRSLEATAPPKNHDAAKRPVLSPEVKKMIFVHGAAVNRASDRGRFGAKAGPDREPLRYSGSTRPQGGGLK